MSDREQARPARLPYEQPQMWYFTFGVGGENRSRYFVVDGVGGSEARERVIAVFGRAWAFQYDAHDWFKHGVSQAEKYDLVEIA